MEILVLIIGTSSDEHTKVENSGLRKLCDMKQKFCMVIQFAFLFKFRMFGGGIAGFGTDFTSGTTCVSCRLAISDTYKLHEVQMSHS